MESLADGTGGTFFHNSNDLGIGFKSLTEMPEVVYVLSFRWMASSRMEPIII